MAVKGAVLGDIIGAQYEFARPKDLDWKKVPLITNKWAGFTDDSVMTLSIKKALVTGEDLVKTMVTIGRRYPNSGYGGECLLSVSTMTTMKRCKRWLKLQRQSRIITPKVSKAQL